MNPAKATYDKKSTTDALGQRLRSLRKTHGLTLTQLASLLGCHTSRVSKIETGKLKPSPSFVRAYAKALQLPPHESAELQSLTALFRLQFDRWQIESQGEAPKLQRHVSQLLNNVRFLRSFQWILIHGLLQVPQYAFEIFRSPGYISEDDVQKSVRLRLAQQIILEEEARKFSFIIAENALRLHFWRTRTMQLQLNHLRTIATNKNVSIKILPFAVRTPKLILNNFEIFDEGAVLIETQTANLPIIDIKDIQDYLGVFRALDECAIPINDATDLLKDIERFWKNI